MRLVDASSFQNMDVWISTDNQPTRLPVADGRCTGQPVLGLSLINWRPQSAISGEGGYNMHDWLLTGITFPPKRWASFFGLDSAF